MKLRHLFGFVVLSICLVSRRADAGELERLRYHREDLAVDLGVGLWAWPLPMDFDRDGDPDLVVVCPDKPSNGTYFFENTSGKAKMPVFEPGVRISSGAQNIQVSYVDGQPRVLGPARAYRDFFQRGLETFEKIPVPAKLHLANRKIRANQWKYCDYDGDQRTDLVIGLGDWTEYGWDDAFDQQGNWTNGPLRSHLFWLKNLGSEQQPKYDEPRQVLAAGKPVDVFGWPSPNFADFDGDGDLDLVCGEFLDKFTYFQNVGDRTSPRYTAGRRLTHGGKPIAMDLQMIVPVAFDWDADGDLDLIVGDEDGRVALVEHTGACLDHLPQFLPPRYFQQQAESIKFGALATPCGFDWDGDGDDDILCGNTAGYVAFIENLGGQPVRWAAPRKLLAAGTPIRIQAGSQGSIQGPCEAKWGYTTLTAGDWDGDQLPDLVLNSIWGKVLWYRNVGSRAAPKLDAARPVIVQWRGEPRYPAWNWWRPEGGELATQWRTTPVMVDFNADGLNDLIMLDHEGYVCFWERRRDGEKLVLLPGKRLLVDEQDQPLRWNDGRAGRSGRRKLAVVDWDGDGKLDLLVNSENADLYRQIDQRAGMHRFRRVGPLSTRKLAGHTSSPTVIDLNGDGKPELLVGAEDGFLYHATRDD